jgi:hypothetical protein
LPGCEKRRQDTGHHPEEQAEHPAEHRVRPPDLGAVGMDALLGHAGHRFDEARSTHVVMVSLHGTSSSPPVTKVQFTGRHVVLGRWALEGSAVARIGMMCTTPTCRTS